MIKFNPFLSSSACKGYSAYTLLIQPYFEGCKNLTGSTEFTKLTSTIQSFFPQYKEMLWGGRAVQIVVGCFLLVPGINTIVLIGLRYFTFEFELSKETNLGCGIPNSQIPTEVSKDSVSTSTPTTQPNSDSTLLPNLNDQTTPVDTSKNETLDQQEAERKALDKAINFLSSFLDPINTIEEKRKSKLKGIAAEVLLGGKMRMTIDPPCTIEERKLIYKVVLQVKVHLEQNPTHECYSYLDKIKVYLDMQTHINFIQRFLKKDQDPRLWILVSDFVYPFPLKQTLIPPPTLQEKRLAYEALSTAQKTLTQSKDANPFLKNKINEYVEKDIVQSFEDYRDQIKINFILLNSNNISGMQIMTIEGTGKNTPVISRPDTSGVIENLVGRIKNNPNTFIPTVLMSLGLHLLIKKDFSDGAYYYQLGFLQMQKDLENQPEAEKIIQQLVTTPETTVLNSLKKTDQRSWKKAKNEVVLERSDAQYDERWPFFAKIECSVEKGTVFDPREPETLKLLLSEQQTFFERKNEQK